MLGLNKKQRSLEAKQPLAVVEQIPVLKTKEDVVTLLKAKDVSTRNKLRALIRMPNLNKMSPQLFVGFTVDRNTKVDDLDFRNVNPEILGAMNWQAKFKQNLRIKASGGSISGVSAPTISGDLQNMQARGAKLGALVGNANGANIDNAGIGYLKAAISGAAGVAFLNKAEDVPIINTWMSAEAERAPTMGRTHKNVRNLNAYRALKAAPPVTAADDYNAPVPTYGPKKRMQAEALRM